MSCNLRFGMDLSGQSENPSASSSAMAYRFLSRYRPIAPKPLLPKTDNDLQSASTLTSEVYNKHSTSGENTLIKKRSKKRTSSAPALVGNPQKKSSVIGSDTFGAVLSSSKLPFHQMFDNNTSRGGFAQPQTKSFRDANVSLGTPDHTFPLFHRESLETVLYSYGGVDQQGYPLIEAPLNVHHGISNNRCNAALSSVDGRECKPLLGHMPFMPRAAMAYHAEKNVADSRATTSLGFNEKSFSSGAFACRSWLSGSNSLVGGCNTYRNGDTLQPQSPEENYDISSSSMRSKDLVTLPLLPDAPPREFPNPRLQTSDTTLSCPKPSCMALLDDSIPEEMIQLSLSTRWSIEEDRCGDGHEDNASALRFLMDTALQDDGSNQGMIMKVHGGSSFHQVWAQHRNSNGNSSISAPIIDSSHLEQTYMLSSDPVMLTDEFHRLLWSNISFKKAASDRMNWKSQERGAYIDNLGVPTALACFIFLRPAFPIPSCKAILWGFLKKMVFQKPAFSRMSRAERLLCLKEDDPSEGKPIAMQPLRSLRSIICLECITEINRLGSVLRLPDIARAHIELSAVPSLLSKPCNSVLCVNAAYKKLVSHHHYWSFEFSNPEIASSCSFRSDTDVSLVFLNDHPPLDAATFSGRARLHWHNAGGNQVITTPCHVKKVHDKLEGNLFLWTFYVGTLDHLGGCSGWN